MLVGGTAEELISMHLERTALRIFIGQLEGVGGDIYPKHSPIMYRPYSATMMTAPRFWQIEATEMMAVVDENQRLAVFPI